MECGTPGAWGRFWTPGAEEWQFPLLLQPWISCFHPESFREERDALAIVGGVSHPFSSSSRALAGLKVLLALVGQGFCNSFRDMKAENPNPFLWGVVGS